MRRYLKVSPLILALLGLVLTLGCNRPNLNPWSKGAKADANDYSPKKKSKLKLRIPFIGKKSAADAGEYAPKKKSKLMLHIPFIGKKSAADADEYAPKKKSKLMLHIPFIGKKKDNSDEEDTVAPHPPTTGPQTPEFHRSIKLVHDRKFSQARDTLSQCISTNPGNSEVWRWRADCEYNLMKLPDALKDYAEALSLDPGNYMARRGKGFCHLHYGHELWSQGDVLHGQRQDAEASRLYNRAHKNYMEALALLQQCIEIRPDDIEAMWGRAMTAEGASRSLYFQTLNLHKSGDNPEANAEFKNCMRVIDHGIMAAGIRVKQRPNEIEPRSLIGGLYFRRANLNREFNHLPQAKNDLNKAIRAQESVLQLLAADQGMSPNSPEGDKASRSAKNALANYKAFLKGLKKQP